MARADQIFRLRCGQGYLRCQHMRSRCAFHVRLSGSQHHLHACYYSLLILIASFFIKRTHQQTSAKFHLCFTNLIQLSYLYILYYYNICAPRQEDTAISFAEPAHEHSAI